MSQIEIYVPFPFLMSEFDGIKVLQNGTYGTINLKFKILCNWRCWKVVKVSFALQLNNQSISFSTISKEISQVPVIRRISQTYS